MLLATQLKAINRAYDYFNATLFHDDLPSCVLTVGESNRKYGGHMIAWKWIQNEIDKPYHQIMLSLQSFAYEPKEVYGILVHEMVHLWQFEFGTPSKNRYHNKEWAFQMQTVGLVPSDTGLPDGRQTGENMSHYIKEAGRYEVAFDKMPKKCLYPLSIVPKRELRKANINVIPRNSEKDKDNMKNRRRRTSTSKLQYLCPKCAQKAYGGKQLSLVCGHCNKVMKRQD
jgi:predicted SprT family Zn-dependent metalloprotease